MKCHITFIALLIGLPFVCSAEIKHYEEVDEALKDWKRSNIAQQISAGMEAIRYLETIRLNNNISNTIESLEFKVDWAVIIASKAVNSTDEMERDAAWETLRRFFKYRQQYPRKVEAISDNEDWEKAKRDLIRATDKILKTYEKCVQQSGPDWEKAKRDLIRVTDKILKTYE